MPYETDRVCPICGSTVRYDHTTTGYDDPDTGDREDPVVLYRCQDGCGTIPEADLDDSPTGIPQIAPVPIVPLDDGDVGVVVEYSTPVGLRTGTVTEVGDDKIWIDVDGQLEHDFIVNRENVVRVVPWKGYLETL